MTERTAFLRQQTVTGANKCMRTALPSMSVADEDVSIAERRALGLKMMFEQMPVYIGEQELIVGTRTYFWPRSGNEDSHSKFDFWMGAYPTYLRPDEIEAFGQNISNVSKGHYTPDLGRLLKGGIGGILGEVKERLGRGDCTKEQKEFLSSVTIAYQGLQRWIERYAEHAEELANQASDAAEQARLQDIANVCRNILWDRPHSFREAVQLLWFGHLGTIIESFVFICYGRLDVILHEFLDETPYEEAEQLIECLLLKMYDQADINDGSYITKHEGQLVVTLGGVLPNGDNAVSDVTMMFLDAIENVNLPDPEFNLRLSSKNPPEFLDKAAALTVKGYNFVSYYNDDLFVRSLANAGIPLEDARCYGFDLCQDINIPGKADTWRAIDVPMAHVLMGLLKDKTDFSTFEELLTAYKQRLLDVINYEHRKHNREQEQLLRFRDGKYEEYFRAIREEKAPRCWNGQSPATPLPFLSALYHGTIENAADVIYGSYPIQARGAMCGTSVEAVNSLAAIKRVVFEQKLYSLAQVYEACANNYQSPEQQVMRALLWNAPKWGNDDPFVDEIAKDVLEFCLKEFQKRTTFTGGRILAGIHQPHPYSDGKNLMATPEGRYDKAPVAVTLTPESGTMKNGPTAVLKSATVFDSSLIEWNFCVMVNYFASVFEGNEGKDTFRQLLTTYFQNGGMQHQPNVLNVQTLKAAQEHPEQYKDLTVRLWGVSAHFVDLPRYLQDEMIARFS